MKTVIEMAREAGAVFPADGSYHKFEFEGSLERFAELVRADEREKCEVVAEQAAREAIVFAMDAERAACAKVCENLDAWNMDDPGSSASKAIRARSNT